MFVRALNRAPLLQKVHRGACLTFRFLFFYPAGQARRRLLVIRLRFTFYIISAPASFVSFMGTHDQHARRRFLPERQNLRLPVLC